MNRHPTIPVWLLVSGLILPVMACEPAAEPEHSHFYAMGTRIELTVQGDADAARQSLAPRFETWQQRWDAWGSGELGELNEALAGSGQVTVPDTLAPVLDKAFELGRDSQGYFHPGLGNLVEAWGFHRQPRPDASPPPTETELSTLLAALPTMEELRLEGNRLHVPRPGLRLDLGGLIKGVTLDQLKQLLPEKGITSGIINLGGDVLVLGEAGQRPWRIGIIDPRGEQVLAGLEVADGECLLTSGDYERDFEYGGERFHHLLHPEYGRPARGTASATVVARDCARADAAATALFVAGPEHWPAIAARMQVRQVMIVTHEGQVEVTPELAPRLDFPHRQPEIRERTLP
ncbi:thiamine biosynthesis lipoprotein [Natronospira proteinivora]|uniref:FAD:protein FMN transferase n=1 Tax=Natronospira proteinivora TaxID=1807133 RepID=A0ABT1GAP8_9GAMM|nr:FAD:protein FMN transferase [Natronospira proteinivora]MCP1728405.1 thiamine biosynthesis lipoprotein [Natronospira proteinivora]